VWQLAAYGTAAAAAAACCLARAQRRQVHAHVQIVRPTRRHHCRRYSRRQLTCRELAERGTALEIAARVHLGVAGLHLSRACGDGHGAPVQHHTRQRRREDAVLPQRHQQRSRVHAQYV
jgi:hypothetical protein